MRCSVDLPRAFESPLGGEVLLEMYFGEKAGQNEALDAGILVDMFNKILFLLYFHNSSPNYFCVCHK